MVKEVLIIDNSSYTTEVLRQILDLSNHSADIEELRKNLHKNGNLHDNQILVDESGSIVAKRIDYENKNGRGSYFTFLLGFDESGWPIVEPTIDDVPKELHEQIYPKRWELVNNRSVVDIDYMGSISSVDTILLVDPENYGSGELVDNKELRKLAIEQGVFRPYPSIQ